MLVSSLLSPFLFMLGLFTWCCQFLRRLFPPQLAQLEIPPNRALRDVSWVILSFVKLIVNINYHILRQRMVSYGLCPTELCVEMMDKFTVR